MFICSPDKKRIEEAGKQRACAEWLVRCGAHVRWEGSQKWERDYNNLPPDIEDNFNKLKIAEVSAVDANVMFNGFVYFGNVHSLVIEISFGWDQEQNWFKSGQ